MKNLKMKKSVLMITLSVAILAAIAMFGLYLSNNSSSADAAKSPVTPSASSNGVVFTIGSADKGDITKLKVSATSQVAKNAAGQSDIVASFSLDTIDGYPISDFEGVTFTVGGEDASKVQGKKVRTYVEHHDGDVEEFDGDFNNAGAYTFKLKKLSVFTICGAFNGGGGSGQDSGDTSPKTGLYE